MHVQKLENQSITKEFYKKFMQYAALEKKMLQGSKFTPVLGRLSKYLCSVVRVPLSNFFSLKFFITLLFVFTTKI